MGPHKTRGPKEEDGQFCSRPPGRLVMHSIMWWDGQLVAAHPLFDSGPSPAVCNFGAISNFPLLYNSIEPNVGAYLLCRPVNSTTQVAPASIAGEVEVVKAYYFCPLLNAC